MSLLITPLFGPHRSSTVRQGAADMDDREYAEVLRRKMAELTEHFVHPFDIDDTLRGVTTGAVDLIDGVESADVLLVAGPELFRSVEATSELAVEVDDLQKRFREG